MLIIIRMGAGGGGRHDRPQSKTEIPMTDTFLSEPVHPALPVMEPRGASRGWDWVTLSLFAGCLGLWGIGLVLPWAGAGLAVLVLALTLHSSLSHEILHDTPVRSAGWGTALGLIQPGMFVPYLRFRAQHLAHHRDARLTDPYDDPESHYLDPEVWAGLARWQQRILTLNNTLLGRMVLGPAIGLWAFYRGDLRAIGRGDFGVLGHWLAHLPGVWLTLWLVGQAGVALWLYLLACYGALSVLRVRTFLEHRAHERASGRSVIIEDRGVLAFLFLNNNYHAVHHMHPQVPWHRLPALYRAQRARFLRVNQHYVYRSYGEIFRRHLLRAKDPVAHPLWRGRSK